jgi:hypothetical protein
MSRPLSPTATFWLIAVPMLVTVAGFRLYLHLVRVQHVYPGGYLVHHLFWGVLLVLPAAFGLAFSPQRKTTVATALVLLGAGSGMILDEIVYLVATKATNDDYVSRPSLLGSLVFVTLALMVLGIIYRSSRGHRPDHQ